MILGQLMGKESLGSAINVSVALNRESHLVPEAQLRCPSYSVISRINHVLKAVSYYEDIFRACFRKDGQKTWYGRNIILKKEEKVN